MGKFLIAAAYSVIAAFWIRFFMHALVWWRAVRRLKKSAAIPSSIPLPSRIKACALAGLDVLFFGRLLKVNAALWLGEWVFHASFLLVIARHLRFFLDPVPAWVWWIQRPGLIAGYVLPVSLAYIFVIRLLGERQKYASRANVLLLALVFIVSSIGVLMQMLYKPDLVDVKMFALGIISFSQKPAPDSLLFAAHFLFVAALVPLIPTHIFTAPLVMMEARTREQALHLIMHEPENNIDEG